MTNNNQPTVEHRALEVLLPTYMTVSRYAKEMMVREPTVYGRITSGDIVPVHVGHDRLLMIDFEKYKHLKFRTYKGRPRKPSEEVIS